MRKIVVNESVWGFMIGRNNVVLTLPNEGGKKIITLDKITGRPQETVDRGRRKKTEDGMVRPSDIKAFIIREYPPVVEEETSQ